VNEREELEALRRMAELEARAGTPDRNAVTLENAGRKIALGARATGQGLLSPLTATNDAFVSAWNWVQPKLGVGRQVTPMREQLDQGMNAAGVPQAETKGEKITTNSVEAGAAVPAWSLPMSGLRVAGQGRNANALVQALKSTPVAVPAAASAGGEALATLNEQNGGSPVWTWLARLGIPLGADLGSTGLKMVNETRHGRQYDTAAGAVLRNTAADPDNAMLGLQVGDDATSFGSPKSSVYKSGDPGWQRARRTLSQTDKNAGALERDYQMSRTRAQMEALDGAGAMDPAQALDARNAINAQAGKDLAGIANRTDTKRIVLKEGRPTFGPGTQNTSPTAWRSDTERLHTPYNVGVDKTIKLGSDVTKMAAADAVDELTRLKNSFNDPDTQRYVQDALDYISKKGGASQNLFDIYAARKHFYANKTIASNKYGPKSVEDVARAKGIEIIDKAMRSRLGAQWDAYLATQATGRNKIEAGETLFDLATKTSGSPVIDPVTQQPVKQLSAAAWDKSLKKGSFAEKAWTVLSDDQKKLVMEINDDLQRGAAEMAPPLGGGSDTTGKVSVAMEIGRQLWKQNKGKGIPALGNLMESLAQGKEAGVTQKVMEAYLDPKVARSLLERYDASKHQGIVQKFTAQLGAASSTEKP
jgi:hypothetical protein